MPLRLLNADKFKKKDVKKVDIAIFGSHTDVLANHLKPNHFTTV